MPIYSFRCECGFEIDELRKMGDFEPPACRYCNTKMEKVFSPNFNVIVGGPEATQAKLKKRSDEQGKRFFSKSAYKAGHK